MTHLKRAGANCGLQPRCGSIKAGSYQLVRRFNVFRSFCISSQMCDSATFQNRKLRIDTVESVWCDATPFWKKEIMYAVIETGSKQYRVAAGDTLEVERLAVEAGQTHTFDRVLLVNSEGKVSVGAPTVAQASIVADVVEHIRGLKKVAFKMKRRKGYHRTVGHRQELTVIKIKEIKLG